MSHYFPRLRAGLLLTLAATCNAHAFDPARIDPLVRPSQNLFRAANGAWLDAPIPPDRAEVYGADLPATVNARILAIVDDLRRQPQPAGSIGRKLLDFHDSQLDLAAIDRAGLAPMRARLAAIDAIGSPRELAAWQGKMQGILKTPLWLWGGFADFKQPDLNRAILMQGGLGMPERDYYRARTRACLRRGAPTSITLPRWRGLRASRIRRPPPRALAGAGNAPGHGPPARRPGNESGAGADHGCRRAGANRRRPGLASLPGRRRHRTG
ncbi:hypothetical protein [Massilia sp. Se16.2.3]|uniref:hypothetical protein n=1 Tax=Massilia sp. Se16.2.3 TaxID=2709303 RepID=UPI001600C7CA|nr:hypothetical protein [Massilia sp. Se16.2.3]QNA98585.1 hypothetical protein G4G31_06630 [Massilia sp. Se16.2.3]